MYKKKFQIDLTGFLDKTKVTKQYVVLSSYIKSQPLLLSSHSRIKSSVWPVNKFWNHFFGFFGVFKLELNYKLHQIIKCCTSFHLKYQLCISGLHWLRRGHNKGGHLTRLKIFKTPIFKRYWKILSRGYSNRSRTSSIFSF